MIASILHDPRLVYPDAEDFFSPSESYPEYPFHHIAAKPNLVYQAVRNCLAQAGLDAPNLETSAWNPLKDYVKPGQKVFLLCNFVFHRRAQESMEDFYSKCTHASVLRSLIDYVCIALGKGGKILFGNASLQSCVWDRVLRETGANVLIDFYRDKGVSVTAKDLRLVVAPRNSLGQIISINKGQDSDGIIIKLDKNSLLDKLYQRGELIKFRVSDYNPDLTESRHGLHKHEYIISNEILTSDTVISVPKLKTHEKVGITIGLKGFVGCVSRKDCLAHHRFGSVKCHGDEYPGNSYFQILLSLFHDFVHRRNYPKAFNSLFETSDVTLRAIERKFLKKIRAGAWYGNDTTWRMVVDLARIMRYADSQGRLTESIQRKHIVFIDGVIGGEGNGPLSPIPVASKCIIFSDSMVLGDVIACKLMGYDPEKIQFLRHIRDNDSPNIWSNKCILNGKKITVNNLCPVLNRPFVPPIGWKGYLS